MKHIKLYEQFVTEAETSSQRPDLIDKYSKFKTLSIGEGFKPLPVDEDGIPAKGTLDQNYPKLSNASSAGVINAGTHQIIKVTPPPFHLKIGKKTAKAGLVSIYLKNAGTYDSVITATEEWFDTNCSFK